MSVKRMLVVLLLMVIAAGAAVTFFLSGAAASPVRGTAYRLAAPPSAAALSQPPPTPADAAAGKTDRSDSSSPTRLLGWPTEQATELDAGTARRVWELLDRPESYRIRSANSAPPTLGLRLQLARRTISALVDRTSGRVLIVDGEGPDDEVPDVRYLAPAALNELTELVALPAEK